MIGNILSFLVGSWIGAVVGVVMMCLLQINRDERRDEDEYL